ncbi:MAG: thioredoxin family protein [Candidatus Altiarchaeota archaeon]|nr:thioredoxin family protein [Candidatus Altiarchaeota archaeon]
MGELKRAKKRSRKVTVSVWKISTIVSLILLVISVFTGGFTKIKSVELTGQVAANKAVKFINENILQDQATAKLEGVEESNGMYKIKLIINDQAMESYISNDGKLLFPEAIDLTTPQLQQPPEAQATQTDVLKFDKPVVELFVMSHCPYGTQIEKGILPVVKELGSKIDFEVKFVNYAMHGKGELDEQLRQYCVQRDYNDKYVVYLGKFLETENSDEALEAAGLSEADISQCVAATDEKYKVTELYEDPQQSEWSGRFPPFKVYDVENKKYGVSGSPTLVINGKAVNSGRDAQSLLNSICGAFTDKPEECSTDMTSFGNPAPGFGFDTQGGSATAAGCGT